MEKTMRYPDRELVIKALLDAAAAAAHDVASDHPTDIAIAMSSAIEAAEPAVYSFWLNSQEATSNGE